jgi:hypothetical protein
MATNPFDQFQQQYANDWVGLVRDVLGSEPDDKQQEVLVAIQNGERQISIRSGHGTGKSQVLAWGTVCHALTRYPQATVATAPNSSQLFDALGVRIKEAFKKLPPFLAELFEVKSESITLRADPEGSFVTLRTSRAETPEALAGVHAEYVLLIADEASGVPEPVFIAAAGSMSGHHATMILAGNPVRTSGRFFDTHHRLANSWHTIHISCVGHPRVTEEFLREQEDLYGLDSNDYRVRVLGEFPLEEKDAVIPYDLVQLALVRDVQPTATRPIWGVDCARFGGDRSALAKRSGNVCLSPVMWWKDLDTMQLAGRIKHEWDSCAPLDRPEAICVDAIGLGAGVADRLMEMGLPARAINVSESPALADSQYLNLRAELWFAASDWFRQRACAIRDNALAAELTWPRKDFTSSGKTKVERKEETKKRLGNRKSPDLADAFILTFAAPAVSALYGSLGSQNWKEPLKREIKCLV